MCRRNNEYCNIIRRVTQGLASAGDVMDDSSRAALDTAMSRAVPLPLINIRLETVIKISEVNICPSYLERSVA